MKPTPSVPAGGAVSRGDAESLRGQWLDAFRRRDLAKAAAIRRRLFVGGWTLEIRPPHLLRPRRVQPLANIGEAGGER